MLYEKLGNSDILVSKICLGTMTFGEQNTEGEAFEQLDYAIEQGVNFIDTAEMYSVPSREETAGSTEKIIGNWFQSRNCRDKVVLATKITGPGNNFKYFRGGSKYNRVQINEAIEGSLKRLKTDYIDLYQLHWPERHTNYFGQLGYQHNKNDAWNDNFNEVLEILSDNVKSGNIRQFGVSNETSWGLMRILNESNGSSDLPRCASIQNPYSLLNRTFEEGLAEISIRENCGLLAYSPLAFGVLSGKYLNDQATQNSRLKLFPRMKRYSSKSSEMATKKYNEIAKKFGLSLVSLSLAFINERPFVTSNIIGATSMEQLKENIQSIKVKLSKEIIEAINKVQAEITNPAP